MFKIIVTGVVMSICAQQLEASPLKCHEDTSERSCLQQSSLRMYSPFFSRETKDVRLE